MVASSALLILIAVASVWGTTSRADMCNAGNGVGGVGVSLVNAPNVASALTISHPELVRRADALKSALSTDGTCQMVAGALACTAAAEQAEAPKITFVSRDKLVEFDARVRGGRMLSDGIALTEVSGRLLEAAQRAGSVRVSHKGELLAELPLSGSSQAIAGFLSCSERFGRPIKYYTVADLQR